MFGDGPDEHGSSATKESDSGSSEHKGLGAHNPDANKKGGFWAKHKVEVIATAVGIAVTVYLYMRSKSGSGTATTSASASPTGASTPSDLGGGGSAGGGGADSGSSQDSSGILDALSGLTAATSQEDTDNAAANSANEGAISDLNNEITALTSQLAVTPQVQVQVQPSAPTPSSTPIAGANYTPAEAQAAVGAGILTPRAALGSEVPDKQMGGTETDAQRHAQEVANKPLRAQLKKS